MADKTKTLNAEQRLALLTWICAVEELCEHVAPRDARTAELLARIKAQRAVLEDALT